MFQGNNGRELSYRAEGAGVAATVQAVVESAVVVGDGARNGGVDAVAEVKVAVILGAGQVVVASDHRVTAAEVRHAGVHRALNMVVAVRDGLGTSLTTNSGVSAEVNGAEVVVVANDRGVLAGEDL